MVGRAGSCGISANVSAGIAFEVLLDGREIRMDYVVR
jgi:hypothetical protein